MLVGGFLGPADKHVEQVSYAHASADAELKLEVERVDDAPLTNVTYLQEPHRPQYEKEDAWNDLDTKLHDSEHHIVTARADVRLTFIRVKLLYLSFEKIV